MTFMSVGAGMFIGFGGLDIGLVATFISTLATNIIATTLIVVKAWSVRKLNEFPLLELTVTGNIVASSDRTSTTRNIDLRQCLFSFFLSNPGLFTV